MPRDMRRSSEQGARITRISWVLASVLLLFTAENIWIDPWLRNESHRIPSLVPEALSGAWFLAFAIGGIILTLLVICEILLMRDRSLPLWTKIGTAIAVLAALLLSVQWFGVTTGHPVTLRIFASASTHTVTLTWKASTSAVAGYNVYRGTKSCLNLDRINPALVKELSFKDDKVANGSTYCYVTRAVDAQGHESINSNEAYAVIP
jgi:hypothetical protein